MIMKRESLIQHTSRAVTTFPAEPKSYDEIVDLFARGASSAEVLAFRPLKKLRNAFAISSNVTQLMNSQKRKRRSLNVSASLNT
jgi:hypothetical protein